MKARWAPFLALFALLAALAFPQSLAEMAKKEKERRKKNDKEAVEVIDSNSLRSGEPSASDDPPADEASSEPDTTEKRTKPPSKESAQERRERCDAELAQAKAEKDHWQTRYDAGVPSTATAQGDQVRGANGRGILGTGGPDVRVGGLTSCDQALKDPKFYPDAAAKCRALQSAIDAAETRIRTAGDCYRKQ